MTLSHKLTEDEIMLILDRKAGESIMIGEEIIVAVLEVGNRNVKLGITAPDSLRILRTELVDRARRGASSSADAFSGAAREPEATAAAVQAERSTGGKRQDNAQRIRRRLGLPPPKG